MSAAARLVRTTTFQLTMAYTVIFAISVLLLLGFIYWSTVGYLERQTDATIEAQITGLAEQYRQRGLEGLARVVNERIERSADARNVYIFSDGTGRRLGGNLSRWPELRASPGASGEDWVAFTYEDDAGNPILVRAKAFVLRRDLRLLVGRDIRELQRVRQVFNQALLIGGGAALAMALIGGLFLGSRVRRRVESISATSARIMSGDLSQRVPMRGSGDEFDELATHLNAMLERIESLMGSVRHVADNIAHDLRTPLTRLRNRLERLQNASPDQAPLVAECVADADRLLATFQALLRIARIESGSYRGNVTALSLRTLLDDACELYQALAEDKRIALSVAAAAPGNIVGDRDLLFQAMANLLDNAVKYTPEGGRIDVTLHEADAQAVISVSDSGPGIAPEMRDKVVERFFRLDASRGAAGSGLGLSLVSAVAELHDGKLSFDDATPGLRATLALPLGDTDSQPQGSAAQRVTDVPAAGSAEEN